MAAQTAAERRTLRVLLALNAAMFGVEVVTGLLAQSTALLADSLDMLADAVVYALSLAAIGRPKHHRIRAALMSGWFQVTLAGLVGVDAVRRWLQGSEPQADWMMGIGAIAFLVNCYCLIRISKHRRGEVHLRASWIFSRNDVIANLGVMASGGLVQFLHSPLPDVCMGIAIAILVLYGGIKIIQEARRELSYSSSDR